MNKTNRSNFTSLSFTVQDDLVSEASISTYISNRNFTKNPFSKNYQPKGLNSQQTYAFQDGLKNSNQAQVRIKEQAHRQAYKQLNNELYNPFQHKLQGRFVPEEQNLYEKQKQRQIDYLKKKHDEELNANTNYVILFNNNNDKKSLKLAANNIIGEQNFSIQDYYQKNIAQKRPIKPIAQDEQENTKQDDQYNFQKKTKKINRQQSNQTEKKLPYPQKMGQNSNRNKQSSDLNSKKQLPIQKPIISSSNQKPKTSYTSKPNQPKQLKKPTTNNFINEKPDLKPNIPSGKVNQKTKSNPLNNKVPKNQQKIQGKKKFSQVYEGADRNLVDQIQSEVVQKTSITFQEIAELQNAKNLLQEAILLPKMMPEFFKGIRKPMKGILMFGPPGTGKTLLAKAVANQNTFFSVSASSLASKWKGESQKMVRILFEMARYYSPSIIFFDEIDAIASKRSQDEHESSRKVKTELLVQMDGVQSSEHQVFVLAATNRPWDLDEALRRRLQKRIYIPLPQKLGRKKMFQINLKEIKLNAKINWDRIVKETEGYSGADISNVCRDAAYTPMRRILTKIGIKKIAQINQKELLDEQLSENDLLEAIKNNKPSVNSTDLGKYQKWMKEFGAQ